MEAALKNIQSKLESIFLIYIPTRKSAGRSTTQPLISDSYSSHTTATSPHLTTHPVL